MKKSTKVLIAVFVASLAVGLFIAFQPVHSIEHETAVEEEFTIYKRSPKIWHFSTARNDILHFTISCGRKIHIRAFDTEEKLMKHIYGGVYTPYLSWTFDGNMLTRSVDITWFSGETWIVCEVTGSESTSVSIFLTVEHHITKRLYETWLG